MFVPLFPFPVPIPLIGEQLLPPNRPAPPAAPPPRMPQTLYPLHQYR